MQATTPAPMFPKVFLDVVPWYCRSRNTDWRYTRFLLPRLVERLSGLSLHVQRSALVTLYANSRYTIGLVRRKLFPFAAEPMHAYRDHLDGRELRSSGCEVVFSHRGFPVNAGDFPVIWQNSILDPEMTASYLGCGPAALHREVEQKGALFRRAAIVQVSTDAERLRLGAMFPDIADRFRRVGFFLPDLAAAPADSLDRHRSPSSVRLLFVGNEARRKGLDLLLDAYERLPLSLKRRSRLKIVSRFIDGKVRIPPGSSIEVLPGAAHDVVMNEMRLAHVLVNAARFESFGFVFLEAMSQGAVAVGPNWEVQRELLDDGRAGVLVMPEADDLVRKLERLIDDDDGRWMLAQRARQRFIDRYAPAVVAEEFAGVFQAAVAPSSGRQA